jgi:hypothetical protein
VGVCLSPMREWSSGIVTERFHAAIPMLRWLTLLCIKVPQAHRPRKVAMLALIGSRSATAPKGARGTRHLKQYISPGRMGRFAVARLALRKA